MARVYVPTSWRRFTGGCAAGASTRRTCGACWPWLGSRRTPRSRHEMFDAGGNLHRFVNVYVNDHGIDDLRGLADAVEEGDEVAVIPAMAGGARRRAHVYTRAGGPL